MVEALDQEQKLERRALRKANELFLKRLEVERRRAERKRVEYDATDDFAR